MTGTQIKAIDIQSMFGGAMPQVAVDLFDNYLSKGLIPPSLPNLKAMDDLSGMLIPHLDRDPLEAMADLMAHEAFALVNMFGYISKDGADYLVERFKGKRFIDPIAGRGWIAKALREAGAEVLACDLNADQYSPVTEVETADCAEFINRHKDEADVMILSWAHFNDIADLEAALAWGYDKPIIVYGELGACCNSKEFCQGYHVEEYLDEFPDLNAKKLRRVDISVGYFNKNLAGSHNDR